jgi:hypothetical protein
VQETIISTNVVCPLIDWCFYNTQKRLKQIRGESNNFYSRGKTSFFILLKKKKKKRKKKERRRSKLSDSYRQCKLLESEPKETICETKFAKSVPSI